MVPDPPPPLTVTAPLLDPQEAGVILACVKVNAGLLVMITVVVPAQAPLSVTFKV